MLPCGSALGVDLCGCALGVDLCGCALDGDLRGGGDLRGDLRGDLCLLLLEALGGRLPPLVGRLPGGAVLGGRIRGGADFEERL